MLGYNLYSQRGWMFALFISESGSRVFIYVSVLRMRKLQDLLFTVSMLCCFLLIYNSSAMKTLCFVIITFIGKQDEFTW